MEGGWGDGKRLLLLISGSPLGWGEEGAKPRDMTPKWEPSSQRITASLARGRAAHLRPRDR